MSRQLNQACVKEEFGSHKTDKTTPPSAVRATDKQRQAQKSSWHMTRLATSSHGQSLLSYRHRRINSKNMQSHGTTSTNPENSLSALRHVTFRPWRCSSRSQTVVSHGDRWPKQPQWANECAPSPVVSAYYYNIDTCRPSFTLPIVPIPSPTGHRPSPAKSPSRRHGFEWQVE